MKALEVEVEAMGSMRAEGSRSGRGAVVGRPVKSDEAFMSSFRPSRCCSESETASSTSAGVGKSRYANLHPNHQYLHDDE